MMNSLTVDPDLRVISFYRLAQERKVILIEESAFPSDSKEPVVDEVFTADAWQHITPRDPAHRSAVVSPHRRSFGGRKQEAIRDD